MLTMVPSLRRGLAHRSMAQPASRFTPSRSRLIWTQLLLLLAMKFVAESRVLPAAGGGQQRRRVVPGNHTRNAAILVSSSRYWHNYRHVSNVLSLYDLLKNGGGFSDEDIILMIADDIPCDGRNPYRNAIYPQQARGGAGHSVYDADIEIDYRGTDVTVANFLRVLTGRHEVGESPSRRLRLTPETNLLVMLTGHGGDGFFKFQDGEELMVQDISDAFRQMRKMGRYNELLLVADTCQAFTLNPTGAGILSDVAEVPNVMTVASSLRDQNSYAHHSDAEIGQSIVDRYTYNFVENVKTSASRYGGPEKRSPSQSPLRKALELTSVKRGWVDVMKSAKLGADVGWTEAGCQRPMDSIPLCDFLCHRQSSARGVSTLLPRKEEGANFAVRVEKILSSVLQTDQSNRITITNEAESQNRKHLVATDMDVGQTEKARKKGRQASDPLVLTLCVGLILCVSSVVRWPSRGGGANGANIY